MTTRTAAIDSRGRSLDRAAADVLPQNPLKAGEYGEKRRGIRRPASVGLPPSRSRKAARSPKGTNPPRRGRQHDPEENPDNAPLERPGSTRPAARSRRTRAPHRRQSELGEAGRPRPELLDDFILREKIMHFDHERIPERVVHARGSGAHGYFECTADVTKHTKAAPFAEVGKRTPVFVRFSTVAGERGSTDTARDVRGFAVKFYTDEGNWDLVGNNIPVFFIQDAMKFPDLVHAAKPEPHFAMPQAASAHDTFWDFVSLMPSRPTCSCGRCPTARIPALLPHDAGLRRPYVPAGEREGRQRLLQVPLESGRRHALARLGRGGEDLRRRLLTSIAATSGKRSRAALIPEWELGLQIFPERAGRRLLVRRPRCDEDRARGAGPASTPVGRLVLDRNPDNFFAETEQVAFCTVALVPGIDFTNDPLLQGRLFSYQDTQLRGSAAPNFHQIPINASVAQVHNNERDGFHQQAVHRGRVSYEPNSLGGGCPFQAGAQGFSSFPSRQRRQGSAARARSSPTLHPGRLFWKSQTPVEQSAHREGVPLRADARADERGPPPRRRPARKRRRELAGRRRRWLGHGGARAAAACDEAPAAPEVEVSKALSLTARPAAGIRTRRVAVLVADGVEGTSAAAAYAALAEGGARRASSARGSAPCRQSAGARSTPRSRSQRTGVLFDAVVLTDGAEAATPRERRPDATSS